MLLHESRVYFKLVFGEDNGILLFRNWISDEQICQSLAHGVVYGTFLGADVVSSDGKLEQIYRVWTEFERNSGLIMAESKVDFLALRLQLWFTVKRQLRCLLVYRILKKIARWLWSPRCTLLCLRFTVLVYGKKTGVMAHFGKWVLPTRRRIMTEI